MTDSELPSIREFNFLDYASSYAYEFKKIVIVSAVGNRNKTKHRFHIVYPDQTYSEPMPREEAIRLAQMQQIALGQPDAG